MRWDLLKAVLWLRWRLTSNQFGKSGGAMQVVFLALATFAVLACLGVVFGGFALGAHVFQSDNPEIIMMILDGMMLVFLFFWLIGLVTEIQRSESIDLQRLLHLPVKLKDVFLVNYLASHFSVSFMLLMSVLLGITIGVLSVGAFSQLVVLPLALSFVFAVSAWAYCLRGWLVQMMVNPRRRRTILILLTVSIIVVAQAPNLFFNVYLRKKHARGEFDRVAAAKLKSEEMRTLYLKAHYYVPPLWVGFGTFRTQQGTWWPAGLAVLAFSALGAAGVRRAYRSTLRFYRGESSGRKKQRVENETPVVNPLEGGLPFVDDDIAVAVRAFWRSMIRAPEMKMAMLGPFVMAIVLGVMFLTRGFDGSIRHATPLIAIGVTLVSVTGLMQIVFNQFGWDREGFRALVLSPMSRRRILFAKNIALFPVLIGMASILYLGASIVMGANPVHFIGGLLQIITTALILFIIGNFISIKLPYRIQSGSLKPTKIPAKHVVCTLVLTLAFPFYIFPVLVGPILGMIAGLVGSKLAVPLNVGMSALMCLLVVGLYVVCQRIFGRMLQESEQEILRVVTAELE